jgi:iron complex transport system substrate-binding protein
VGKETDGKALVAATEDKLRRTARENPAFATKTVSILLACSGKGGLHDQRHPDAGRHGDGAQTVAVCGEAGYGRLLRRRLPGETLGEADADVVVVLSRQSLPANDTFAQYPQIARMAANAEQRMVYPEDANIGPRCPRPRC